MSEIWVNKTMNAIKIAASRASSGMTFVTETYNQPTLRFDVDQKKNPAAKWQPDL